MSKDKPIESIDSSPVTGFWSFRPLGSSETISSESSLDEAFRMYLNSAVYPIKNCPIETWQYLMQFNLVLSKLAMKYLTIPATSVPSERVFSKAGQKISKLRSSLEPKRAEKLIILSCCDTDFVYEA